MSQQSVRQAARRTALELDAQAVLRKQRADRERRLEALAVTVLTALGERDAASGTLSGAPGRRCRESLRMRAFVDGCRHTRGLQWADRRHGVPAFDTEGAGRPADVGGASATTSAPKAASGAVDDLRAMVADLVWEPNSGVGVRPAGR
jgi:hypothetical protein